MARTIRLPLEQLQPYLLEVPSAPAPLDLRPVFGNDHPVELEVGSGKGLFLLTASAVHPDVNYLGIEVERKYTLFTANRLAKRQRSNVRLICADARTFLPGYLPDASFRAVHVYFPDPWWKNRHRKRRLFTEDFARQCARVLQPGGRLHLASDVEDYFHIMTGLLERQTLLTREALPERPGPGDAPDPLTNFERKYREEGRAIHRAYYRKVENASST